MTEREELLQEVDELRARQEQLARRAIPLDQRCRGLREDNPWDYRIAELSRQVDALDEEHDRLECEIGQKHIRLREIEIEDGYVGLSEFVADAAYARKL